MSGRWIDSNRRAELPANWSRLCAQVARRSGGRCEHVAANGKRCPRKATDVDHATDPANHRVLQHLCRPHHAAKTKQEALAGKAARLAQARRPPERHPGQRG